MLIGVSALAQQPAIIPIPDQMTMGTGEWTIKKGATVSCDNAQLRPAAEYLSKMLSTATGYRWAIANGRGSVRLSLDPSKGTGAYSLSVTAKGATIVGGDYRGVVNGIATLRQLLPADIEQGQVVKRSWKVPCVTVNDRPRFDWRGMELDCSRHFFTVDEIKHLLDVLALYKIDKLHWQLTDDQGWRSEIKRDHCSPSGGLGVPITIRTRCASGGPPRRMPPTCRYSRARPAAVLRARWSMVATILSSKCATW